MNTDDDLTEIAPHYYLSEWRYNEQDRCYKACVMCCSLYLAAVLKIWRDGQDWYVTCIQSGSTNPYPDILFKTFEEAKRQAEYWARSIANA